MLLHTFFLQLHFLLKTLHLICAVFKLHIQATNKVRLSTRYLIDLLIFFGVIKEFYDTK